MKYKTKSIEVQKFSDSTGRFCNIVTDTGENVNIDTCAFNLLFEPAEEESDKQDTVTCDSCNQEFFSLFKETITNANARNLCTDCWNLKIKGY